MVTLQPIAAGARTGERERGLSERHAAVVGGNRARQRRFEAGARASAATRPSASTRFIRHPPPSATRVARAPRAAAPIHSARPAISVP